MDHITLLPYPTMDGAKLIINGWIQVSVWIWYLRWNKVDSELNLSINGYTRHFRHYENCYTSCTSIPEDKPVVSGHWDEPPLVPLPSVYYTYNWSFPSFIRDLHTAHTLAIELGLSIRDSMVHIMLLALNLYAPRRFRVSEHPKIQLYSIDHFATIDGTQYIMRQLSFRTQAGGWSGATGVTGHYVADLDIPADAVACFLQAFHSKLS